MEKLSDLMGTKYLTADFVGELRVVLESVNEVDLVGCKFTPGCERVLRDFYDKVYLINSGNERLNEILKHNMRAKTLEPIESVPFNVQIYGLEDFKETLKSLSEDTVYNLEQYNIEPRKCIALATAITLKRPEIKIDLNTRVAEVFNFVRENWLKVPKQHDKYWKICGNALIEVEVQEDGYVRLENGGLVKETQFIQLECVVPKVFGTEVLIHDEEFRAVWLKCIQILDTKQRKEKHMKDYIGGSI